MCGRVDLKQCYIRGKQEQYAYISLQVSKPVSYFQIGIIGAEKSSSLKFLLRHFKVTVWSIRRCSPSFWSIRLWFSELRSFALFDQSFLFSGKYFPLLGIKIEWLGLKLSLCLFKDYFFTFWICLSSPTFLWPLHSIFRQSLYFSTAKILSLLASKRRNLSWGLCSAGSRLKSWQSWPQTISSLSKDCQSVSHFLQ